MTRIKGIMSSDVLDGVNRVFSWLEGKSDVFYADYINENLELKIKKMRQDFFSQFKRYVILRRGFSYIIKDNRTTKEIFQFPFTKETKEEIYAEAVHTCQMLNEKDLKPLDNINNNISYINEVDDKHCHHHSSMPKMYDLSILVQDTDGNAISNASVIIENKTEKITNIHGICTFDKIKRGTYVITISADGYVESLGYIYVNKDTTHHAFELQSLNNNTENINSNDDTGDTNSVEGITPPPMIEEEDEF